MSKELITTALTQLDVENDDQWTGEGLPLVDTVKALAGLETLTRAEITDAAPNFNRTNPTLEVEGQDGEEGTDSVVTPVETFQQGDQSEDQDEPDGDIGEAIDNEGYLVVDLELCTPEFIVALTTENLGPMAEAIAGDLTTVRDEVNRLNAIIKGLEVLEVTVMQQIDNRAPRANPHNHYEEYIKTQDKLIEERKEKQAKMAELGLSSTEAASVLDHVMRRRNMRHTQRPNRMLKK